MNEIGLGAGYTQIYRDGINNNLLSLDLQFNNRTDSEARAILHFLEQHYGAIPFQFNPRRHTNRLKLLFVKNGITYTITKTIIAFAQNLSSMQ